jgi:hypothetical protein
MIVPHNVSSLVDVCTKNNSKNIDSLGDFSIFAHLTTDVDTSLFVLFFSSELSSSLHYHHGSSAAGGLDRAG